MLITKNLIFLLVIVVGGILLQIFLSRQPSKWPGLILPVITFLYSMLAILGFAAFDSMGGGQIIMSLLLIFLLTNIPTLILMAIYFTCRSKYHRQDELEKMKKQDLE